MPPKIHKIAKRSVNLSVPVSLIDRIDAIADHFGSTRSSFLSIIVMQALPQWERTIADPSDEFYMDHLKDQSELLISLFSAMDNLGAFDIAKSLRLSLEEKKAASEP